MKIVFTKDFATKKKGDAWECDSVLGRQLITRKVAKPFKKAPKK